MRSHSKFLYWFIILVIVMLCIGQDPCKNVTCGTVCVGVNLWEQKCVKGECIDNRVIELNSPQCGYTPCEELVCNNECYGTELWKMKCVNGKCVLDSLIERFSTECGVKFPQLPPDLRDSLNSEEYEVYNAIMRDDFRFIGACWIYFSKIQADLTDTEGRPCRNLDSQLAWIGEEMSALDRETILDFKVRNSQLCSGDDHFDFPIKVIVSGEKESGGQVGFGADSWHGVVMLSAVGFNSAMDQALVYVGSICGPLSGGGSFVFLTKEESRWTVQDSVLVWIS